MEKFDLDPKGATSKKEEKKMNECDYCNQPKRILIYRNGLRFTIDGEEREINTLGREPKMCLDCFSHDLLSEIDFEEVDA